MIPGENLPAEGTLEFNQGRQTNRVSVTNFGDRAIMVGIYLHYFVINKEL